MASNLMSANLVETYRGGDAHSSGVSWGAVIAGAFVAAALSLILLALGAGMGLSSISPWSNVGVSAATFGTASLVWLIFIQIVSWGMGGYLAGRLRTRWATIHTDEVYFRDTANGFLVWAVGLVITVTFLASSAASMVGGAAQEEIIAGEPGAEPNGYFVDSLFRSVHPALGAENVAMQSEAARILAHTFRQRDVSADDRAYLAQLVGARTGLSPADAEKRVTDVIAEAARFLLWLFVALLIGALSASVAATLGGKQRDHVKLV
jgi:hypothetical protein